jgi:hypothetical protein
LKKLKRVELNENAERIHQNTRAIDGCVNEVLIKHDNQTKKTKTIPKRSQKTPKTQRVPLVSADTKSVSVGKRRERVSKSKEYQNISKSVVIGVCCVFVVVVVVVVMITCHFHKDKLQKLESCVF